MTETRHKFSVPQLARREHKSRSLIMAAIRCGELEATDERRPGSVKPRYFVTLAAWAAWLDSRRVIPVEERPAVMAARPMRPTGLLARRRAKRRMKAMAADGR